MVGLAADVVERTVEQAVHPPPQLLRPYVDNAVGFHLRGFPPGEHIGLPSRHLTLIVTFDAPLVLRVLPDGTERTETFDAMLGGLHTSPALIAHDGNQHGIHVHVTPAGAWTLFGVPAGELAEVVVDLEAVWGRLAVELSDRLATQRSWTERFAVLDEVLLRALAARVELPSGAKRETMEAWRLLTASGGAVPISAVADEVGWSRRHLSERFAGDFGVGPKQLARVLRFERARDMIVRPRRPSLATVAATCGYADQAHMARDWRSLAGLSPTAWLAAEELSFVQAEPAMDETSWFA